jgi:hypothetical protein
MDHELKSWPRFFEDILIGKKSFELRRDDRDFQVGDTVVFKEWDEQLCDFTGRKLRKKITYIVRSEDIHPQGGLQFGFCIFSFS